MYQYCKMFAIGCNASILLQSRYLLHFIAYKLDICFELCCIYTSMNITPVIIWIWQYDIFLKKLGYEYDKIYYIKIKKYISMCIIIINIKTSKYI